MLAGVTESLSRTQAQVWGVGSTQSENEKDGLTLVFIQYSRMNLAGITTIICSTSWFSQGMGKTPHVHGKIAMNTIAVSLFTIQLLASVRMPRTRFIVCYLACAMHRV